MLKIELLFRVFIGEGRPNSMLFIQRLYTYVELDTFLNLVNEIWARLGQSWLMLSLTQLYSGGPFVWLIDIYWSFSFGKKKIYYYVPKMKTKFTRAISKLSSLQLQHDQLQPLI